MKTWIILNHNSSKYEIAMEIFVQNVQLEILRIDTGGCGPFQINGYIYGNM